MLTFLKKKPYSVLGIDISPTAVKLLELSNTKGQYCVEGYGQMPLKHNSNDADAIAICIKRLISNANVVTRHAVVAVPDACVIRKILQISAHVPEQDIDAWVYFEAEKYIPYPLNEINLDYNILGLLPDDSECLEILVVASRSENVDWRVESARRAGLVVQIVDVESCAIERAAGLWSTDLSLSGEEKQTALFDIDPLYLRCFVFSGSRIIFSREDALDNIHVLPRFFEMLLQQIKRALQFFSLAFLDRSIDQIALSGSMARLHGLQTFVQAHLRIPTHIANPFTPMRFATPEIRDMIEKDAPMLMIACGLALRR